MDPQAIPPEIAHTALAAGVIAGIVRGLVGLMRTHALREVWTRLPWWAKPTFLVGAAAALGVLDAVGFHQPWYLAVGSAITGLGGAVVSHEWQALFKEAILAKAEAEKLPDTTPPSGVKQPDTIPDGKPTGSKP